jgi:nitrogen fixation protein FixH
MCCCMGALIMDDFINRQQEMQTGGQQKQRTLSGRTVAICFVGFFVVVTSVNAFMMTMAIKTMPGVDVKSAYEASQTYNAEIMRAHEQDARGWTADVTLGKGPSRDVRLRCQHGAGSRWRMGSGA